MSEKTSTVPKCCERKIRRVKLQQSSEPPPNTPSPVAISVNLFGSRLLLNVFLSRLRYKRDKLLQASRLRDYVNFHHLTRQFLCVAEKIVNSLKGTIFRDNALADRSWYCVWFKMEEILGLHYPQALTDIQVTRSVVQLLSAMKSLYILLSDLSNLTMQYDYRGVARSMPPTFNFSGSYMRRLCADIPGRLDDVDSFTVLPRSNRELHQIDCGVRLSKKSDVRFSVNAQGQIQHASIGAIVHFMTSDTRLRETHPLSDDFMDVFMTSFRFFSAPSELLSALVDRHDSSFLMLHSGTMSDRKTWYNIRTQVYRLLLNWLRSYWRQEDEDLIEDILDFIERCPRTRVHLGLLMDLHSYVLEKKDLQRRCMHATHLVHLSSTQRRVITPAQIGSGSGFKFPEQFPILTVDQSEFEHGPYVPMLHHAGTMTQLEIFFSREGKAELARQLTHYISDFFKVVDPVHALEFWRNSDGLQSSNEKFHHLPGAHSTITLMRVDTMVSNWVSKTIVFNQDRKSRARLIEFWLDVALICLNYNNFLGSCAIKNGLAHSSVSRMKETVLTVKSSSKRIYVQLERLFDGKGNHASYRALLKDTSAFALPLISVLNKDIFMTVGHENMKKSTTHEKMIALQNYRILKRAKQTLEMSLQGPFPFPRHEGSQHWLNYESIIFPQSDTRDIVDLLYTQSGIVEPRNETLVNFDPWKLGGTESKGKWKFKKIDFIHDDEDHI